MDVINENTTIIHSMDKKEVNQSKEKLNIILFSAGKLISLLGTYIYSFAMSLYILKLTGSGTSFAFSILLGVVPRVLLSPIAGSLADRVDRKKMIVGLDFLSGIVVLLLFGLSSIYGLKLVFIYTATFILAVISTFFNTCFSAAIPRLVSDKSLVKINSYSSAIESGGSILGPILGGMAFGLVSISLFLIINGVSFILSGISEIFINFELNKTKEKVREISTMSIKAVWQDIKEVFGAIKANSVLTAVIPFSISINFFLAATFSIVLPYIINNVLRMSSSQYGFIDAAFSIGMLLAAILVAKLPEKEKKRKGLIFGIIGMGITVIVMGIPGMGLLQNINILFTFGLYIVLCFSFAFLLLMINMPMVVTIQRSIPNDILGRMMGAISTISSCMAPLGIILAGIALDIIPAYIIFFITGAYFIISAILLYKNKGLQEY